MVHLRYLKACCCRDCWGGRRISRWMACEDLWVLNHLSERFSTASDGIGLWKLVYHQHGHRHYELYFFASWRCWSRCFENFPRSHCTIARSFYVCRFASFEDLEFQAWPLLALLALGCHWAPHQWHLKTRLQNLSSTTFRLHRQFPWGSQLLLS